MIATKMLRDIDEKICFYLGFDREETFPTRVQLITDQIIVTNTVSYKRHLIKSPWGWFCLSGLKQTNLKNRKRLGLAIGKAIAEDLVISFEPVEIKSNQL